MEGLDYKIKLLEFFSSMRLDRRNELMNRVLNDRTRYITLALENIFQPHNASAVLRSCDCFGVQDVHVIENSNAYELNPQVALGSVQWLNLHRHNTAENNTASCIAGLKQDGYRIVATSPNSEAVPIHGFDVGKGKFALLFGTERKGLSEVALSMADEFIRIPMYGFTESFNISVSVSLCLFHFTGRIRNEDAAWQLTYEEKLDIHLHWLRNTVRSSALLEQKFYSMYHKR